MVGGAEGLGNRLTYYSALIRMPQFFAIILILAVMGISIYGPDERRLSIDGYANDPNAVPTMDVPVIDRLTLSNRRITPSLNSRSSRPSAT